MFTISDRLRKAREFASLEQGDLAEAIEVSRATISNYEVGRVEPRRITVRQWALRCGVSFDWLMHGRVETTTPDGPERWAPRDSNPQPTDYESAARTGGAIVIAMPGRRLHSVGDDRLREAA